MTPELAAEITKWLESISIAVIGGMVIYFAMKDN